MKETYRLLVKLYKYKENEYAIVQGIHDGIIRAINYNCLDENGKTTQPLNGIEMFCSKEANTVEEIIKRINLKIDFDEYIKQNDIDTSACIKLIDLELKRREIERDKEPYADLSDEELEQERQRLLAELQTQAFSDNKG